jgi:hypothetical protein
MYIVILNGSPKKKRSASRFFSNILRTMLFGCSITEYAVGHTPYDTIFEGLKTADAALITVPLYVDSIPSHVLRFLDRAEQFCACNACHFTLYVISNSGFIPGRGNEAHLDQYKCWCARSGIVYGGGLGIGGGVMLHAVFFAGLFFGIGGFILKSALNLASGAAFAPGPQAAALAFHLGIWLFFSIDMLISEYRLAGAIKKRETVKNRYTSVMIPPCMFLVLSDIFMALAALCKGAFWKVFRRV